MPTTFRFTARRKDDGSVIHTDTITDIDEQGMGKMAATIRSSLVASHPDAADLEPADIEVEMSLVLPGH